MIECSLQVQTQSYETARERVRCIAANRFFQYSYLLYFALTYNLLSYYNFGGARQGLIAFPKAV